MPGARGGVASATETVARYLAARADVLKASTLERRMAAISAEHRVAGYGGISVRDEPIRLVWAGIHVADVETASQGLVVHIRRSKTDQEGQGRAVGIPWGRHASTCPVRAYMTWLEASGIASGPIFRPIDRHGNIKALRLSAWAVALVVKRAVEACGLDPIRYSGHSLRAWLATSAAAAGVEERLIMAQTGHRSEKMVRRYIREGDLFRRPPRSWIFSLM